MIATCGLVAAYLYAAYVFLQRKRLLEDFPGPLALPIVGNLYDPSAFSVIQYVRKCMKSYGKVFQFWAGQKPMLVVADPGLARQILSNTVGFVKGSDYTDKFGTRVRRWVGDVHWRKTQAGQNMSWEVLPPEQYEPLYLPCFRRRYRADDG